MLSETLKRELARYAIGPKIRALRWRKELRLAEVAKRTGLSSSLLSKIERGQSVPSLKALQLIAIALEVTLPYFFPKPRRSVPAISRAKERILLPQFPRDKDSSFDFECLNFPAVQPRLDCYRAYFRRNSDPRPHAHPGSEFLFVLAGTLKVTVPGEALMLADGDSMYFDSSIPHSYQNAGECLCSALVVTFSTLPDIADLDLEGTPQALRLRGSRIIRRRAG